VLTQQPDETPAVPERQDRRQDKYRHWQKQFRYQSIRIHAPHQAAQAQPHQHPGQQQNSHASLDHGACKCGAAQNKLARSRQLVEPGNVIRLQQKTEATQPGSGHVSAFHEAREASVISGCDSSIC